MYRWIVLCLVGLVCSVTNAHAATRLGLQLTIEEVNCWKQRAGIVANNSLVPNCSNSATINGVTFQNIYTNRILNDANSFRSQSHSGGDGFWAGYTGAGCVGKNDQSIRPGSGSLGLYGRGNGAAMVKAALVYVLTGDTSYATPVKTELVAQAAAAGTDFTNNSKWCLSPGCPGAPNGTNGQGCDLGGGNQLEIMPWLYRVILAYDYLKAGGYTGWTTTEENNIRTWLSNAATRWSDRWVASMAPSSYPGAFNTPQDLTPVGGAGTSISILWFGGPTLFNNTYFPWYNQPSNVAGVSMAAGIVLGNSTLIQRAHRWFTGFLTAGTWNNGAMGDFYRWIDCSPGCPGAMWDHVPMGWLIILADLLARTGDTSLYTFNPTSAVHGQGGSAVRLDTAMKLWADMVNDTVVLYGTTNSGDLTPGRILTWDSDVATVNNGNYADMSSMAANLYYQNATVTTAMGRTLKGTNSNSSSTSAVAGCNQNQYGGCFSGAYAWWPDLPFMYGNMEGVVNPYPGVATPATCAVTAPSTFPLYSTTTTPLTTIQGTASPGTTSLACVNNRGGSCTPSGSTVWSIPSVALSTGRNVLTITPTDAGGAGTPCTLKVDYQTVADIASNLEMHLPLDDGVSPTADITGHGHAGTLLGGATWVPGKVGANAVQLNGTNAYISVSGLLGSPTTFTLAGWFKLADTLGALMDFITLGDYTLLEVQGGALRGWYFQGATVWNDLEYLSTPDTNWHHLAYVYQSGEQVLYLDGAMVAYDTVAPPIVWTGLGTNTFVGHHANTGTAWLNGAVDDIRVYTRALTGVDVAAAFALGTAMPSVTSTTLKIVK